MNNKIKHTIIIIFISCVFSLSFIKCKERQHKETSGFTCQPTKIVIEGNTKDAILNFNYQKDTLKTITSFWEGAKHKKIYHYKYSKQGLAEIKSRSHQFKDKASYIYEKGRLKTIKASGNFITKRFRYNDKSQIVTEYIFFNKKLYQIINYEYHDHLPIAAHFFDVDSTSMKSILFKYDNAHNPFSHLGMMVNQKELIYGYAPANAEHGIKEAITIYQRDSTYKVRQRFMIKGDRDTTSLHYLYNQFNYPLMIDNRTRIYYNCKQTAKLDD